MLRALFGPKTVSATLREGLDNSMAAHRAIADRVAQAVQSSAEASELEAEGQPTEAEEQNIIDDMASLADTQIRYEAEARLLQLAYQRLRTSIRNG